MKNIIILLIISITVQVSYCQPTKKQFTNQNQLIIKTIVAKGSVRENEFGKQADWIEIYNNGEESVNLGSHKWYLSDNPKRLKKYRLPNIIIKPKKSIIVWCDDENRVKKEIHANFKLSSYGETITLSLKKGKEIIAVDSISYSPLNEEDQMAICRTALGLIYKKISY